MRLSPRQQGDLGEFSAMEWLNEQGYCVFIPLGHSPDIDLIATRGEELIRVQVKTCGCIYNGRFAVAICTRGGNQSWSGTTKYFENKRCDRLFVLCSDGRRWFIPASQVEGRRTILLGGPKYARYEIEPGRPFLAQSAA